MQKEISPKCLPLSHAEIVFQVASLQAKNSDKVQKCGYDAEYILGSFSINFINNNNNHSKM